MEAVGVTNVGRSRDRNEDRFLVAAERGLFVVADGMGGHQAGEVASQLAVEVIAREISTHTQSLPREALTSALLEAHQAIQLAAQRTVDYIGMGTTAVVAWIPPPGGLLWIAHVGDSRAYLARAGAWTQLTEDHTLVNQFARAGVLPADPKDWPPRHALSQALGASDFVAPDVSATPLETGDVILLCSDGLTDTLTEVDFQALTAGEGRLQALGEQLVQAANQRGGRDNITLILIRVAEPASTVATRSPQPPREEV